VRDRRLRARSRYVFNIVQPVSLRTSAGRELVIWDDTKGSFVLRRNGTQATLLSGLPFLGKPALRPPSLRARAL